MKTHIQRFWLTAGFLLFLQGNATAQPGFPNLHQTVTHEGDTAARMLVSNQSHREKTMPQNQDFGTWNGLVTIYKQYFGRTLRKVQESGFDTGIPISTLDYKQWTKDDLRALATSYNGFHSFETLIILSNAAVGNGSVQGKEITEQDKNDAQAALQELAPNGMSWKKFYNIIADLQEETEDHRKALRARHDKSKRHSAVLKELSPDIAGDAQENPEFTQQQAQALLKKAGVVKDDVDTVAKPLETAVTDAVKGMKSSITIAA